MLMPAWTSELSLDSFLTADVARRSATPPPGTIPSSTAARVACMASSTRSFSPRRRDQGAEILLPIESVAEADTLRGEMLRGDARALSGGDLHALPVFFRGPGAVELAAGAGRGREQDLLRRGRGGEHRRDRRPQLVTGSPHRRS